MCISHALKEKFWGRVLLQTLDSTDAKWLDDYRQENDWEEWDDLELAFIRHFQQPNIHALRRQQLKSLSVKSCGGVQRYADEFTRLAGLLGWDFSSRETIYEFKLGLHVICASDYLTWRESI